VVFLVVKCKGYTILEVELLVITKESVDAKISLTLIAVVVLHWIGYALDVNDPLSKAILVYDK